MTAPLDVSFEYFPPATDEAAAKFEAMSMTLAALRPSFATVTYGAGGTTQSRTLAAAARLAARAGHAVGAHLTCVGASRADTLLVAAQYRTAGLRHVVALRGDPPKGAARFEAHPEGFSGAAELVGALAGRGLEVAVAGYPEGHPESQGRAADLAHLKRKAAGAARILTQYCFDDEAHIRFRDDCAAAGIKAKVVPGIMPIVEFEQLCNFSARCGARIPAFLHEAFARVPHEDKAGRAALRDELCAAQLERLRRAGFSSFHIYTMNRVEPTRAACAALGIFEAPASAAA